MTPRKKPHPPLAPPPGGENYCCRVCMRAWGRYFASIAVIILIVLGGLYFLELPVAYERLLGGAFVIQNELREGQGGRVPQGGYLGSTAEIIRKQYQLPS